MWGEIGFSMKTFWYNETNSAASSSWGHILKSRANCMAASNEKCWEWWEYTEKIRKNEFSSFSRIFNPLVVISVSLLGIESFFWEAAGGPNEHSKWKISLPEQNPLIASKNLRTWAKKIRIESWLGDEGCHWPSNNLLESHSFASAHHKHKRNMP